jgi:hypothetical protein
VQGLRPCNVGAGAGKSAKPQMWRSTEHSTRAGSCARTSCGHPATHKQAEFDACPPDSVATEGRELWNATMTPPPTPASIAVASRS